MRRVVVVLTLSVLAGIVGQAGADCVRIPSPQEAFEESTVVFSGEAIARVDYDGNSDARGGCVLFKVGLIWKGPIRETFIISLGPSGGYRLGETYFVYAEVLDAGLKDILVTRMCSRQFLARQAVWDRAVLREPYVVDATKVLGRPSIDDLEELASSRSAVSGQARKALEDIRRRRAEAGQGD